MCILTSFWVKYYFCLFHCFVVENEENRPKEKCLYHLGFNFPKLVNTQKLYMPRLKQQCGLRLESQLSVLIINAYHSTHNNFTAHFTLLNMHNENMHVRKANTRTLPVDQLLVVDSLPNTFFAVFNHCLSEYICKQDKCLKRAKYTTPSALPR